MQSALRSCQAWLTCCARRGYQWIILHEFLPQVVDPAVLTDVLQNGRRYYKPRKGDAFIPVEFQIAYRMGHSMVRPSYRARTA